MTPPPHEQSAPCHVERRLPDGLIVDRDIAQIIHALRASGVVTVESCADGWRSGMAYVVVETTDDLAKAAALLGHGIDPQTRDKMNTASPPTRQCMGSWWPSTGGWVVGKLTEPGHHCPVLAWPTISTRPLSDQVLAGIGAEPVRLRRLTVREWLRRHG